MQNKKSLKDLILFLICGHDGTYTWYQLERELEWRGLGGSINTLKVADLLTAEGLVTQGPSPTAGFARLVYSVTEDGRKKAHELVRKHGLDFFRAHSQNRDDYEL